MALAASMWGAPSMMAQPNTDAEVPLEGYTMRMASEPDLSRVDTPSS